jgi:Na+/proline symporter
VGASFLWSNAVGVNQFLMQRFISLPSIGKARKALKIFVVGVIIVFLVCAYNGLLIYARFHDCDPLTTKAIKVKDQLIPLFVMDLFEDYPGFPGLFVAGVFSAALSTLSTCLNSMSVIILNDFIKPYRSQPLSKLETHIIMKGAAVMIGIIIVGLVFIVEKMGTVLQLSISLAAATIAPIMGIFTMGIVSPHVNATVSEGVIWEMCFWNM